MPFTHAQIQAAQAVQHAAAQDPLPQVRLVAGPGTGKSFAIEERVRWLLAQGVSPTGVCAVSFTRAAALDLSRRVRDYCSRNGQAAADQLRVATLHSLALRILRAAGLLTAYPAEPLILDSWELENVFDAEFGDAHNIRKRRREDIRREHEAFWSTGQWAPPNYIPPSPAITPAERAQFTAFHGPRTQTYSCVLPGEIIRQCVAHMKAGSLNPVTLLNLEHLIVDEFQDLNPLDLEFVDGFVARGVKLFVAGDDDQSIYSFRFASPAGIQRFTTQYPGSGQHVLSECFRCTPTVLGAGQTLITANPAPNRIGKNHVSLYAASAPPVAGVMHRWTLPSGVAEAQAIAESCRDLIQAGISPREILILLSNQRALGPALEAAFQKAGVAFEPPRSAGFLDSDTGRLVLALVRIACDTNDYVAHRVLLGIRPGVGIGTCNALCDAILANNLNFRAVFYQPLPTGVFAGRSLTALNNARAVCGQISNWQGSDTVLQRLSIITAMVSAYFGAPEAQAWQAYAATLPDGMSLEELRNLLWADTDEQQAGLLQAVYTRLGKAVPTQGVLPARVRGLTMHGAKGLSASIVFVPGLEEPIFPGPWRQPYPGLVLEAARLLYVSITRARAACILSHATTRIVNGKFSKQPPSRFVAQVQGTFSYRTSGLDASEVQQIAQDCAAL